VIAPEVLADMGRELLAEASGGDALEGADQPGQGDLRGIVHQEVDMVGLAIELGQLRTEARYSPGRRTSWTSWPHTDRESPIWCVRAGSGS
jgi:hypothetical protein